MSLRATTPYPDEVRKQFHEYADVLDIYASDQIAMMRRKLKGHQIRAEVYAEIAAEIRSIIFEAEKAG
jgi:hypothetical protein